MASNFNEENGKGMSYADGFRFGFGFFIANLLGSTVIVGMVLVANYFVNK